MASQSRPGRLRQAPARLADEQAEQARQEAERRRRIRRGAGQQDDARDHHPAPAHQQVQADEGVDVAAEEEEEERDDGGEDEVEEEENDEGYDSFIEERSRPPTPQPNPTVVRDADGWKLIAKLGPTASFLSSFPALQEVPDQHVHPWEVF